MDDSRNSEPDAAGYSLEDLSVGMSATYERAVTEADVVKFAQISGDHNPVHLDEAFALQTRFKGRIVHGMLSASFLSTVIASRLPGPGTIYLAQNLSFRAPVRIGDKVEAKVTVIDIVPDRARVMLKTVCRVGETVVIDGDALVMVPVRG
ncbi:MAG TPA: MaoC family dehydratase [Stellaceae bacterium]|jgi:3-hydroxybutyryl-CoA dehydratase|nr:MaoC family dehydratase [Stellaceae bacterium]